MESFGFISLLPPIIVITMAIITKKAFESMLAGTVIAYILYAKQYFIMEFTDSLLNVMSDPTVGWIIIITGLFGGLIAILEKSGGAEGFKKFVLKHSKTKEKTLIIAWLIGLIIFIDEYLNALTIGAAMKKVTDERKIPREMLAYVVNSTATPVSLLLPLSTWSVFFIGLMANEGIEVKGSSVTAYIHTIPYIFYAWIAVIMVPLVIIGIVPKLGSMKLAWKRVDETGNPKPDSNLNGEMVLSDDESKDESATGNHNLYNFLIPIVVLIIVTVLTGVNLTIGLIIALTVTLVLYLIRKVMTLGMFMDTFWRGFESMIVPLGIVVMSFVFKNANEALGLTPYIIETVKPIMIGNLLPAVVFLVVAVLAFATGTFWGLTAIVMPIVIPLAAVVDVNIFLTLGALFSGACFGSHACFYSDLVIISSRATEISPIQHAASLLPYAIIAAILSTIGFLVFGFVM